MSKEILAELAHAKALFQLRALRAVMGFNAQGMSAEGENSRSEVEGEARQPGPKDAP